MAHPPMFASDDPWLARVRELALALPEAAEKVSHGRPAFFTGRVFCYFGGSQKVAGEWVQHPRCVLVHPGEEERSALLTEARCFAPAYLAPSGWVGVQLPGLRSRGGPRSPSCWTPPTAPPPPGDWSGSWTRRLRADVGPRR